MATATDTCPGCGQDFSPGGYANHLRLSSDSWCGLLRDELMPGYAATSVNPNTNPTDPDVPVTNWHFSRSFHFYSIALTLVVTVQSLISNTSLHSLSSISPSYFVSDHQEINNACIQSQNVANTTLITTTDGPFQDKGETTRLSNCPEERQDQRPPPRSANRHDRSSASLPRHRLPRCPPERSTPTCRAKDQWTRR